MLISLWHPDHSLTSRSLAASSVSVMGPDWSSLYSSYHSAQHHINLHEKHAITGNQKVKSQQLRIKDRLPADIWSPFLICFMYSCCSIWSGKNWSALEQTGSGERRWIVVLFCDFAKQRWNHCSSFGFHSSWRWAINLCLAWIFRVLLLKMKTTESIAVSSEPSPGVFFINWIAIINCVDFNLLKVPG